MKAANVIIFQIINRGFNSAINIRVVWINVCGMLVYKLTTSNVTSKVSS